MPGGLSSALMTLHEECSTCINHANRGLSLHAKYATRDADQIQHCLCPKHPQSILLSLYWAHDYCATPEHLVCQFLQSMHCMQGNFWLSTMKSCIFSRNGHLLFAVLNADRFFLGSRSSLPAYCLYKHHALCEAAQKHLCAHASPKKMLSLQILLSLSEFKVKYMNG